MEPLKPVLTEQDKEAIIKGALQTGTVTTDIMRDYLAEQRLRRFCEPVNPILDTEIDGK